MTQKITKNPTFYTPIDEDNGRRVSAATHITVSEAGTLHVGTYLLFGSAHIHVGKKYPSRARSEQFRQTPRKYRTKTEARKLGEGAFNVLEKHREDMKGVSESLTTEFAMDWIAGFKLER